MPRCACIRVNMLFCVKENREEVEKRFTISIGIKISKRFTYASFLQICGVVESLSLL